MMKHLKRFLIAACLLIVAVMGYFVVGILARPQPEVMVSTQHPTLSRDSCIDCHAPIAAEWRESYHHKGLTGPFWQRINDKGFADLFERLRLPCKSCHAPANVLDLTAEDHPVLRSDAVALGVDCVSCHVSSRGIMGPGRAVDAPHEAHADARFRVPVRAATGLCARCHEERAGVGRVVSAWQRSEFAAVGVGCVDCHMPRIDAPVVTGGEPKRRRSHRFAADKNIEMLKKALNASIVVTEDRKAVVRVINDRVGHDFPAAGTNSLIVKIIAEDESGQILAEKEHRFGTRELIPGYLDFWPFLRVSRIPAGERRDIVLRLPATPGKITAEFSYRDWFAITDKDVLFASMTRNY